MDVRSWIPEWGVTLYADERVEGVPEEFTDRSWNHADLFARLQGDSGPIFPDFPLETRSLGGTDPLGMALRGGGQAYLRFRVAEGEQAGLRTRSGSGALPEAFHLTILRTR